MATAKKTAPKKSTEVAVKSTGTGVATVSARLAAMVEANKNKVEDPSGNKIRATQDKKIIIPGGGTVDETDVVIIDFVSTQTFYSGKYDEKNIVPPDCFAIGDNPKNLVPSPNSPNLQVKPGQGCNVCPNFQWGSDGVGKLCKSGRRLAVLPAGDDTPLETPLMIMDVSPTALRGFDGMIQGFTRNGMVPIQSTIHVDMNPAMSHASFRFSDPQPNTAVNEMAERLDEAAQLLKKEPDVSSWQEKVGDKMKKPAARARR